MRPAFLFCTLACLGCGGDALVRDEPPDGAFVLRDIRPGSADSDPDSFVSLGRLAAFSAAEQIWTTDGTTAGTIPRALREPGQGGSIMYFAGTDDTHGTELWKTDGTAAGTVLVKDINPGPTPRQPPFRGSSHPRLFTEVGGTVFFTACDGVHGWELWKTDGSAAGTTLVADVDPRPPLTREGEDGCLDIGFTPGDLREFQGLLYFFADDGGDGLGLWRSDGTAAGTYLLRNVPRERPSGPRDPDRTMANLTKAAGRLFFNTRNNLWVSDGTTAGTIALPPVPTHFAAGTSSLFYYIWGGGVGRSDGTEAGTFTVRNLPIATDIRFNARLTEVATVRDRLYFIGQEPGPGPLPEALWTSDGTIQGTQPVAFGDSPVMPSAIFNLLPVGESLYFLATDALGRQLWRADGANARRLTGLPGQVAPEPFYGYRDSGVLGLAGRVLLFPARDPEHGLEPWGYGLQ